MMVDFIIILVLVALIGGILFYLIREKKKGNHCVGCPYAGQCSSGGNHSCSEPKNL